MKRAVSITSIEGIISKIEHLGSENSGKRAINAGAKMATHLGNGCANEINRHHLVSDTLDLAGLPPGEYTRGERTLLLTPNVVKLPKEDVLAGAASPISLCVGVVMDYTQCSLAEAIQMASTNPAEMMSLQNVGVIEQGKRADVVLFTMEDKKMKIDQTYIAGELVYSAN